MPHPKNNQLYMPARWLITGGCGFIGTSLIKRLIAEGRHTIRVLDNLSVGTRKDLAKVCDFSEKKPSSLLTPDSSPGIVDLAIGDIKDPESCITCAKDVDVIVHLAANTGVGPSVEEPRKDMGANVIGTFNMLEAARMNSVRQFVFASSGAPMGECEPPIHEEMAPRPVSPYGASKLAGEGYCSAYYGTFGLKTVALRFSNVYGPGSGRKNSVVGKFIKQAMNGETLEIYGDGSQTRDFIYIDDLINAIYKAANPPLLSPQHAPLNPEAIQPGSSSIAGEVFQIATHSETTVGELADVLVDILNSRGVGPVEVIHCAPRKGDVRRSYSDTTKAAKYLNWKAEVDLEKGLKQTVDWFFSKRFHHENQ